MSLSHLPLTPSPSVYICLLSLIHTLTPRSPFSSFHPGVFLQLSLNYTLYCFINNANMANHIPFTNTPHTRPINSEQANAISPFFATTYRFLFTKKSRPPHLMIQKQAGSEPGVSLSWVSSH